ncbi:hypothetical protein EKL30_17005 [Candidimonas sp. SYP-B2681]|uniref:ATP-dependent Clp protease proteolytic subunit n=1 Tax=Candidimonas sp. SYP-B2681 TaxID=2497686 RepID=UPI000F863A45|nr:ATP-dependent Clp protease proteolytic subunit [Candidimonas sp. SYP-B2681]RTZ39956.1 hypothetical protein EKL30_17005 [Candidimonas sp. SYP-B2681]
MDTLQHQSLQSHATQPQNIPVETVHVIHMACPITPASIQQLHNCTLLALQEGAQRLELRISSLGGCLASGFAAYGLLRSLPVPVRTHNNGNVESAAVVIYLAGSERTAATHSRFVIHPLNWGTGNGSVDHNRIVEWADSLNFDRDRYRTIFDEATDGAQIPIDILKHLNQEAIIIGPADAESAGITTRTVAADTHKLPFHNVRHLWISGF